MPGLGDHQQEMGPLAVDRGVDRLSEQGELALPADERAAAPARPGAGGQDGPLGHPGPHRFAAALGLDLAERRVAHRRGGWPGTWPGPTTTWPGRGDPLQPAGDVDHVAHGGVVAVGPQRPDQHLAGVDADAHLEVGHAGRRRPVGQRLEHLQGGPYGPVGVVLVGDRGAEHGHDGVAENLVDPAAVRGDVVGQGGEHGVDEVLDLLGIAGLGQRR